MKKIKICSIITAALMTMSIGAFGNTVKANAAENEGCVKVQMYNTNTSETTIGAGMQYDISNTSNESINLADVKIRYYFTADNSADENFYCDYAALITGYIHSGIGNKVKGEFVKMDEPKEGADHYLEISFTEDAGILESGADVRIQSRFSKQNWTTFNQTNDYSFNAESTGFEDWNKTAVFINDNLVSGEVPSDTINFAIVKKASVSIDMYNVTTGAAVNTINPRLSVTNTSDEVIDLSKLKLNYYFTEEGSEKLNVYCDYAGITKGGYRGLNGKVTGTVLDCESESENNDKRMEIGFTEDAGILDPGETMEIHLRLAKENWTNFNQENDYSYNDSAKYYEPSEKLTAFIDESLVWGNKPGESTLDEEDKDLSETENLITLVD